MTLGQIFGRHTGYWPVLSPSAILPSVLCSVMPGLPTPQLSLANCSSVPLTGAAVVMNSIPPGPWTPHPYDIIPPHCNMALWVSPEPSFPVRNWGSLSQATCLRRRGPEHRVGLDHAIWHTHVSLICLLLRVLAKTSVPSSMVFNDTESFQSKNLPEVLLPLKDNSWGLTVPSYCLSVFWLWSRSQMDVAMRNCIVLRCWSMFQLQTYLSYFLIENIHLK